MKFSIFLHFLQKDNFGWLSVQYYRVFILPRYKTRGRVFLNAEENDEDHGKKKNGKSEILYGAHLGHCGGSILEYFEFYLLLFCMVIVFKTLVVKGILVFLFC